MEKKYLHPVLNKEVDKEIYFNFHKGDLWNLCSNPMILSEYRFS